jgi:HlyD family secretion protein
VNRALLAAAIVALLLTTCGKSGAGAPAAVPLAAFATIANGKVDIVGGVVEIAARRFGVIKDVLVHEGDVVKKGQVLAARKTRTLSSRSIVIEPPSCRPKVSSCWPK